MKLIIFISLILTLMITSAQKVFILQNETCVELYTSDDPLGEYLIYMVYDEWDNPLTEFDIKVLKQWKNLTYFERTKWTEKWICLGKHVECLRPGSYDENGKPVYENRYAKTQPFL